MFTLHAMLGGLESAVPGSYSTLPTGEQNDFNVVCGELEQSW